ncbi:MAG: Rieske (2Fe-2S) protein [Actinomycetota bacterium]|nr:Rieske (2Fe-2S) protein [Actinomycetota bacterium]
MNEWRNVGAVEDRADLGAVTVDGLELALARLDDGSWVAFDNACTHEECPLSDGDLDGNRIICYCHSSVFDLGTGEVLEGPAEDPLAIYDVRISKGELEVRIGS